MSTNPGYTPQGPKVHPTLYQNRYSFQTGGSSGPTTTAGAGTSPSPSVSGGVYPQNKLPLNAAGLSQRKTATIAIPPNVKIAQKAKIGPAGPAGPAGGIYRPGHTSCAVPTQRAPIPPAAAMQGAPAPVPDEYSPVRAAPTIKAPVAPGYKQQQQQPVPVAPVQPQPQPQPQPQQMPQLIAIPGGEAALPTEPAQIIFDPTTGVLPGIRGLPGGVSPFSVTPVVSLPAGRPTTPSAGTPTVPLEGGATATATITTPTPAAAGGVSAEEAEAAAAKIKYLEDEVAKLREELGRVNEQWGASRERGERLEKENSALQQRAADAEAERDALWAHVGLLQERVSTLTSVEEALTAELDLLRTSHQHIGANMGGFQKELAESMSNIMLKYIRGFNIAKITQDAAAMAARERALADAAAATVQRVAASEAQLRSIAPARAAAASSSSSAASAGPAADPQRWLAAYEELCAAAGGSDPLASPLRFDEPDDAANIAWAAAASGGREVSAATAAKALEVITSSASLADPALTGAFCITFRTFMSPRELLAALATRYRESEESAEARLVREKTLGFLQKWLDMFPRDFADAELRALAMGFVCTVVNTPPWTPTLSQLILRDPPAAPAPPLVAEDALRGNDQQQQQQAFNLLDAPAEEVAQQLCLLDAHMFAQIQAEELIDPRNWTAKEAPCPAVNVLAFIQHWNRITNLVLTETMAREDYKERAKVLRHFVNIGRECYKDRDFNAAAAIAFAIKSPAVSRMHQTMEYMHKHFKKNEKQALEVLERISENAENWKGPRAIMNEACPPAVPHIGIYLGDLVFLNDGNPDMIDGMINFSKKRMVASIISKIIAYQKTPYTYQLNERIAHWLEYSPVLSKDVCFETSKKLEPKINTN